MKRIKNLTILLLSLVIFMYFAYLFLVPKLVNFNQFTSYLESVIAQQLDINLKLKNIKIKTTFDFAINTKVEKVDLYKNNEKFAQINNLKIKVSVLPLLLKTIHITDVSAEKCLVNLKKDYFVDFDKNKNSPLTFSNYFPSTKIDVYRISLLEGKNNYTIKGKNLELCQSALNKHIKLLADGKLIIDGTDQINYSLKIKTNYLPDLRKYKIDKEIQRLTENLKNLKKYKVYSDISSDIAINKEKEIFKIKGFADINDVRFTYEGKKFLPSQIQLNFKESLIYITSKINIDKSNHILIDGNFSHGKNKSLDMKVVGKDINIADISSIIKIVSKSSGIKELQNLDFKGNLNADFNVKSDFKNIVSKGFLKIKNGSAYHKTSKLYVNDINTNIDFSNNIIKIVNATAKIHSNPVKITGNIDKNANANIKISGNNINLSDIKDINLKFKDYKVSGVLNFVTTLQGQLKTLSPKLNASLKNFSAYDFKHGSVLKMVSSDVFATYDKNLNSNIKIFNLEYSPDMQNSILIPRLNLNVEDNNLTIEKNLLWINNIKSELSGSITNILEKPQIENLHISIPNYTTVPIKNYHGSSMTIKGDLKVLGKIEKPTINGYFVVPSINIPSLSLIAKDITLKATEENITLNCQAIRAANSLFKIVANIDSDISKGVVVKNIDISSPFINLDELENALRKQKEENIIIKAGKFSADSIKLKGLQVENVTSNISAKNNMLYMRGLRGEAYTGVIAGDVNYDKSRVITWAKLQGRNLSAKLAIPALTNHKDDISGKLDFDGSFSFKGYKALDVRKSISGNLKFQILNGKMGMLGKLEHLLYAQNVVADSILKASLNLVTKAVTTKNTGVYKFMKGNIVLNNGVANIKFIKTSGPSMSLFMKGKFYITENLSVLTILGRISNDVVSVLGPIGEFSVEKALSSIFKKQLPATSLSYFAKEELNDYYQIPELNPKTNFKTREFRVYINGDPYKQSSVLSFEWLVQPKAKN